MTSEPLLKQILQVFIHISSTIQISSTHWNFYNMYILVRDWMVSSCGGNWLMLRTSFSPRWGQRVTPNKPLIWLSILNHAILALFRYINIKNRQGYWENITIPNCHSGPMKLSVFYKTSWADCIWKLPGLRTPAVVRQILTILYLSDFRQTRDKLVNPYKLADVF